MNIKVFLILIAPVLLIFLAMLTDFGKKHFKVQWYSTTVAKTLYYEAGNQTVNGEWLDCVTIAKCLESGVFVPMDTWNHFYNPDLCTPPWAKDLQNTKRIGDHIFGTL